MRITVIGSNYADLVTVTHLVKLKIYATGAQAWENILDHIEMFYNPVRRHGYNNCLSPVLFEK